MPEACHLPRQTVEVGVTCRAALSTVGRRYLTTTTTVCHAPGAALLFVIFADAVVAASAEGVSQEFFNEGFTVLVDW